MLASDLRVGKYYKFKSGVCYKVKDLMVINTVSEEEVEVNVTWYFNRNGRPEEMICPPCALYSVVDAEEVSILEGMVNVGI